jgi:hypothetical protein
MNIAEANLAVPPPHPGFYPHRCTSPPCGGLASGPSLMTPTGNQEILVRRISCAREQTLGEKILSAMRKCVGGRLEPKAVHP